MTVPVPDEPVFHRCACVDPPRTWSNEYGEPASIQITVGVFRGRLRTVVVPKALKSREGAEAGVPPAPTTAYELRMAYWL
jgi:hypothetical protein